MTNRNLKTLALGFAVAVAYFLASRQFTGPAYLADEIGFLSKAAFLAGFGSDGASTYRAGYSLLLAPLFRLARDPAQAWTFVLLLNALMWGGTLALTQRLLARVVPDAAPWRLWLAIGVVALFPASVAMSGYAFSQSAFAFFFSAALYALSRWDVARPATILPHAFLTGYLAWIHPIGLAVGIASLLVVGFVSHRARRYAGFAAGATVVVGMVLAYAKVFEPWLLANMTVEGLTPPLNRFNLRRFLHEGVGLAQLRTLVGLVAGQMGYLLVATLGFIGVGTAVALAAVRDEFRGGPARDEPRARLLAFCLLAVLGCIAMAALSAWTVGHIMRVDHWIYGRYVEPATLLLFAVGLATVRVGWRVVVPVAALLLFTGAWLAPLIDPKFTVNFVTVPALWPQVLFPGDTILGWFALGAAAAVVALRIDRRIACAAIAVLFVLCISAGMRWHRGILDGHSNPSRFVDAIELNYPPDTCVGFDVPSLRQPGGLPLSAVERPNLYSFLFHHRPMRRLTPQMWKAECAGPLLTYDANLGKTLGGVRYLGRERGTGLFLVARASDKPMRFPQDVDDGSLAEESWRKGDSDACLIVGCFDMRARQLAQFSKVGKYADGRLATSGAPGYLFFGPYVSLRAGTYVFEMQGRFDKVDDAIVDVASDQARKTHFKRPLAALLTPGRDRVRFAFHLDAPVGNLEVRLAVGATDRMWVRRYDVSIASPEDIETLVVEQPANGILFNAGDMALVPHVVGTTDLRGRHSDGRKGYLMFGPYRAMPAGRYRLQVRGTAPVAKGAWIDVASAKGKRQHASFELGGPAVEGMLVDANFVLDAPVEDLEVRAFVTAADRVTISGYSLLGEDGTGASH